MTERNSIVLLLIVRLAGIVGVDLDHCFDPENMQGGTVGPIETSSRRTKIYSEFSPSGQGVRIFEKGSGQPNRTHGQEEGGQSVSIRLGAQSLLPGIDWHGP